MAHSPNHAFEVHLTYACLHTEEFTSPGHRDPQGILAVYGVPCCDDVIRVEDLVMEFGFCDPNGNREFRAPLPEKKPVLRLRWYTSPLGALRARFREVFE